MLPTSSDAGPVRRRNIGAPINPSLNRARGLIESFDIYEKHSETVIQKTSSGTILSVLVWIICGMLVFHELGRYWNPTRKDQLSVDLSDNTKENLLIYFNITFPSIQCTDLHIDTIDASGEAHIDIHHHIYKHPVNKKGLIMEAGKRRTHSLLSEVMKEKYDPKKDPESSQYCGSCYGAETSDHPCCNTCYDVQQQFKRTGKKMPNELLIDQCIGHVSQSYPGCNMYGVLNVSKVSGNFHFAPGRSFSREQDLKVHHIHEFNPVLINRFNTSHIINQLSFGPVIKHIKYPLNGLEVYVDKGIAVHKYFIKVVPTTYQNGNGPIIKSNSYSFTRHVQKFDMLRTIMLPGIFFVFDMSAIQISHRDYYPPFLHFIVNLMAVVGGIVTVMSALSAFLDLSVKQFSKKHD